MRESIYILIATYNATPYLLQQVESICTQSKGKPFSILIRDDSSHDDTIKLLQKLVKQYENIYIVKDNLGQLGATGNFAQLLEVAHANGATHCLCSDQDDVWTPQKINLQQQFMCQLEQERTDIPLLIHSDMEVVDVNLKQISPSFMAYQGIHHENHNPLQVFLCQNFVTGCTMMVSRSLLELALPIPKEALLHDWWLALCAATFGKIEYIDQPLVKYRQHGNNEVGAKHIKNLLNPFKNNWYQHWNKGRKNLHQSIRQAQALVQRIQKHDPNNKNLALIESYASILQLSPWKRIQSIRQHGIHAESKLRHMLFIARMLSLPKERS